MASCVKLNVKKMAKHIIGVGKLTKRGTTVLLVIFYLPGISDRDMKKSVGKKAFFPLTFSLSRSEIPGKFRIVFSANHSCFLGKFNFVNFL